MEFCDTCKHWNPHTDKRIWGDCYRLSPSETWRFLRKDGTDPREQMLDFWHNFEEVRNEFDNLDIELGIETDARFGCNQWERKE